ncbi:two-component sensor histidine kinase [Cohnella sp. CBP 2801]|uniref:histidine kinase n=2 Tax=Cohnella zeiphila TaxID=2761120 RepID=A0A7X0SHX4_9BACL|nr:two-component sensor histidine kinase [Cohnella zeiphila]
MQNDRQPDKSKPHRYSGGQPRWYHVLFGVSAFFLFFTLCWTAGHYITVFFGPYWPYGQLHPTLRDYLALVLALFLFGFSMTVVRWIVKPEQRAANAFTAMVDAMQRMSKGDFNINLEAHPKYAGELTVLVDNLNRMASELGQMEQMRQEFISNVSHEIQSPLTAIKGFAQALRQDGMDPNTRDHYLKIIETESERMSRMSDNLIRLSTLESRNQPFRLRTFRLDRQIRQAVLSCEPLWVDKRLEMDIRLDEVTLEADEELLNQVWRNLLHNAIKFTPEGGTLTVGLGIRGDQATATFADTGVGIAEADIPHLFERFFKADKARNRSLGGSGLGLSIVKKIVDLHGGAIDVESRPVEGTTFTVRLPLSAVDSLRQADEANDKISPQSRA